ncbi:transcription activator acu-15 [Fusarium pseudoanthophilum]|uniref:Transcription activator acu-15 n=1 Tax=Fusarium pseudoanthophilum TaxID=48495 RepID=A0A8H5NKL2_9HYPO|nr:transcription activator acu-15 [Fusarium pseudoanthophilum]
MVADWRTHNLGICKLLGPRGSRNGHSEWLASALLLRPNQAEFQHQKEGTRTTHYCTVDSSAISDLSDLHTHDMPEQQSRQRRRKVTLACDPCRERKSRCDGIKPICSTCRRRALGIEQCVYRAGNARTECSDEALHDRIRYLEGQLQQASALNAPIPDSLQDGANNRRAWPESTPDTENQVELDALVMGISHTQLLTPLSTTATESIENSSHARRVTAMGTTTSEEDIGHHRDTREGYYGSSSAASFLKETCGTAIPPSTDRPNPQNCTSQPTCLFGDVDKFALPPRRLADHLVERYFERIYWIYPVFDKQAFEHGYNSLWLPSGQTSCPEEYRNLGLGEDATTVAFFSSLNAIFALGCIFSNLSTAAKTKAYEVFFSRAKDKVNLELLDINDLSVVQTLVLVALVLQGTSFPDRCWNTTGLACRVAQGLGLHSLSPYNQQESRGQRIRRRTWHGCIVLDTLVSMTFGRPTMITNISTLSLPERTVSDLQNTENHEDVKLQFQIESVRLSIILDSMLSKVYRPWQCKLPHDDQSAVSHTDISSQSMDVFAELQGKLRVFELGLPKFLSWHESMARETIPPHEVTILAIQRNVLQSRFTYLQDASDDLHSSFKHDGARACVRSSIHLINLVHETFRTETAEAWWWNSLYACTASLVLMTCRLCPSLWATLDQSSVIEASNKCHSVLEVISSFSLSIRKSFDLLTKMHQTITGRQQVENESTAYSQEHQRHGLLDTLLEGDLSLQNALTTCFPLDPDAIVFPYWEAANLGG